MDQKKLKNGGKNYFEYGCNDREYYPSQPEDYVELEEMAATERELAEDAQWKLIQKNTFTRWANEHLKTVNKHLQDIEVDFSDGLRLISLVEVLSNKNFNKYNKRPNFRTQKLENVTMCLTFLEVDEGIRIVNIDSSDIVDSKLKLILGLIWTLILHYSISMPMWEGSLEDVEQTPKQRLLGWIQNKMPDRPVANFTTNWNDGIAIGALVDSVAPGLCPDYESWKPQQAVENAKEAMNAAEKWLDVPQLIKPEEMTNSKVDEMSMMTYLSQFPNCQLKPGAPLRPKTNPARVRAYGSGIEPKGNCVNVRAQFTVETFSAGRGEVEVIVMSPNGKEKSNEVNFNNDRSLTYSCFYKPTMAGQYRIIVMFAGVEIPKSPYIVDIEQAQSDASKCLAAGPGIEETGVKSNVKTYFEVFTRDAGIGIVIVALIDPTGRKDTVQPMVTKKSEDKWHVEYTAPACGIYSVNVFYGADAIPGSPYAVKVYPAVDAKLCYATGRGLQPRGVRVGDQASFKVHTPQGAGDGELQVVIAAPGQIQIPVKVKKINALSSGCIYEPKIPGAHAVTITYGGSSISRSPFDVEIGPPKTGNIRAYGPGLKYGVVGHPTVFTVETNGETGALGFSIEGPSQSKIDCKDNGDGSADITYCPTAPGEYAIHILCDEEDIPLSPFMAEIEGQDSDRKTAAVVASGPGLEKTGVIVNKWTDFTVDARKAGKGQMQVTCMDAHCNPVDVLIKDNHDGMYNCRYRPNHDIKHTLSITHSSINIPNSPFRVFVQHASDPGKVRVTGPAIERSLKTFEQTYLVVDCSAAGPGDVAIALTDNNGADVPVQTIDNHNNTFKINFEAQTIGEYSVSVFFAEEEIPSSPFTVNVQPSIDLSNVEVDDFESKVFIESMTHFTVDASSVSKSGHGVVGASVTAPSGAKSGASVKNNKDGTYRCTYVPVEQGTHKIEVTYEGLPIPKSPLLVNVASGCDPTRVRAYGSGLDGGVTHQQQPFTVETRGAGQGSLGLAIEGPSEAKMTCRDNQDGSCIVDYLPTKKGVYDLSVRFAEQHIPGSPFKVKVVDQLNPSKVKCFGPCLDSKSDVCKSRPTSFTIDASEAGEALLEIITVNAHGKKQPEKAHPTSEGIYRCTFIPECEGPLEVDVKYGKNSIPNSPFTVNVKPDVDPSLVKVLGPGVETSGILATVPSKFHIDTSQAGKSDLDVSISNPDKEPVHCDIIDCRDGTFEVTYTPEYVGQYIVEVKYAGQKVLHSPFVVHTSPTGDSSKVKLSDVSAVVPINQYCIITVDALEAGQGNVTCNICNPNSSYADVEIAADENNGTVNIMYVPRSPGEHSLDIRFGGRTIPNGQFTQTAVDDDQYSQYLTEQEELLVKEKVGVVSSQPDSDLYEAVDFRFLVGPVFGLVSAKITKPSGQTETPIMEDNGDGSVTFGYQPTEVGLHRLDVNYDAQPIQGSPFKFHVDLINAGYVTAHGPGLMHGQVGEPADFTIVTKEAGAGGLSLAVEGPSKAQIKCRDNKNGTCSVCYFPMQPGEYSIIIKFADKHIVGSPFTAKIAGPSHELQRAHLSVGSSSEVSLRVSEADISSLVSTIRAPSGLEEPCTVKHLANGHLGISFTPREIGEHLVNVYRMGQHIPSSPFKIFVGQSEIGSASKVRVHGKALTEGTANEVNEFMVNTKDAGYGGLSLSIEGPSKADIECQDNEDGSCRVTYKPVEPGSYNVNVKFADEHIPGSPFPVRVTGEGSSRLTEQITRQRQAADATHVGSQCELSLKIPGTSQYDMEASVTSPSGITEICNTIEVAPCQYSIKFVPKEMGIHTVSVKHKGVHIPGSPFQFTVGPITDGGSHKVRAMGPGLENGEAGKVSDFNIYTREAGAGGLSIAVEGPSKADINFEDRKDGSCGVAYTCSEPGEYLVSVKFNDQHIPDSPFKVYIIPASTDAHKLMMQRVTEQTLQVNKPASFTVDFNQRQEGNLDARVVAPSGVEAEAIIQEMAKDQFAVRFVPRESGIHLLHVQFEGLPIPGSPYRVMVGGTDADPKKVQAHGDGLSRGFTDQPAKFIVDTLRAGSGALAVTIDGPSKVLLDCQEVPNGYEFSYVPTVPGEYLISIKYAGTSHIPGSPFKACIDGSGKAVTGRIEQSQVVVEMVAKSTLQSLAQRPVGSDVMKVVSKGMGLTKAFVNKDATFTVDAAHAGHNVLMVGVMGQDAPCEDICIKHLGNNKYNINYRAKQRGQYIVIVKWGDAHVPGSPYLVVVH